MKIGQAMRYESMNMAFDLNFGNTITGKSSMGRKVNFVAMPRPQTIPNNDADK